jgi:hypothetical protein
MIALHPTLPAVPAINASQTTSAHRLQWPASQSESISDAAPSQFWLKQKLQPKDKK